MMAGVLPANLGVASRSEIALSSASCLAKSPAFAIHGYGVRRAEAVLRLFPPHPGGFVNFRPLPPEDSALPIDWEALRNWFTNEGESIEDFEQFRALVQSKKKR